MISTSNDFRSLCFASKTSSFLTCPYQNYVTKVLLSIFDDTNASYPNSTEDYLNKLEQLQNLLFGSYLTYTSMTYTNFVPSSSGSPSVVTGIYIYFARTYYVLFTHKPPPYLSPSEYTASFYSFLVCK